MTALANQTDATGFGYGSIASGYFNRASTRVTAFARSRGYALASGTYTVTGRGPSILLPNRPVASITSVTDAEDPDNEVALADDEWTLREGGVIEVVNYPGNLRVVYVAGPATVSDEIKEIVCHIASRMSNTSSAAASGVQQETGGSESVTFGFDAYSGIADLTKGELAALGRLFPKIPQLVVMRA